MLGNSSGSSGGGDSLADAINGGISLHSPKGLVVDYPMGRMLRKFSLLRLSNCGNESCAPTALSGSKQHTA